jgi:hypothetical protein
MKTETNRSTGLREAVEALRHMTVGQLKDKYRDVFGESSRSNHKQFLFRRIAWRMQANAEGGISERARRRALEIANDADLRIRAPKNFLKEDLDETRTIEARVAPTEDPRLPMPGSELVRRYRGKDIVVRVREEGSMVARPDYQGAEAWTYARTKLINRLIGRVSHGLEVGVFGHSDYPARRFITSAFGGLGLIGEEQLSDGIVLPEKYRGRARAQHANFSAYILPLKRPAA